jgi:hypothetical protein
LSAFLNNLNKKSMKKFSMVAAATLLVGTLFTSCKKDYSCECSYYDGNGNKTSAAATIKGTKADAKKACDALNANYAMFSDVSCKLK